ncbi:MAG: Eco57I restriction-modification methylase domain-containing protein, partial [Phycisphaerae bacterium]
MASASEVKALADHYEWLGYLQPVGLLVSPAALLDCQAYVDRNIASQQQALLECLGGEEPRQVADFTCFAQLVLGWRPDDALPLASNETLLEALSVSLPEYSQTLCPTFCVRNPHSSEDAPPYLMLIKQIDSAQDFDRPTDDAPTGWKASPQAKFERLLRETGIPIGILFNGEALRLVYCPVGENSGHITFPFEAMAGVAGRPILSALHMLLCAERLFSLPTEQRLPALLAHSRNAQSRVSEQLAGQVLAALYEMVRGFQAANAALKGDLLNELLAADPDQVYKGVLTVLMRLVFLLYAEDRGLISASQLYSNFYSVTGLFNRLRSDAALHPDTMEQRFGAWAQLLVLFRLIHRGTPHAEMSIPPREGYLFDPDRYPFLEGQRPTTPPENASQPELPRISDRVIYRVLEKLMVLDGQRLSYRTLDVEQIGSVYETMIGFELIVTTGSSIVLRPSAGSGAPAVLNLDAVLAIAPEKRAGWIKDQTGHEPKGQSAKDVQSARTVADVLISLEKKIDREITPALVSTGAMLLHPTDERRRSGSHYTPRSLTEPIVRKALEPVLAALGAAPEPERILDLKICDPAMGSGAFLVEVCRQLADQLVRSWRFHKRQPTIPVDEDEILHARRLVAQSCLYGVDRNPMAVDLARLSLWLATLAQDHPFTFLDHVLRCGDSLVGLTRKQIVDGRWQPTGVRIFGQEYVEDRINKAAALRTEIFAAGDAGPSGLKAAKLALADEAINGVRFFGDVVIAAFFSAPKDKLRLVNRDEFVNRLASYLHSGNLALRPGDVVNALRSGPKPVIPFHWEVEFPEVFDRENAGFDSMVGNPPFAGKNTLIAANRQYYPDWLDEIHEQSNGNTDLAAHFFRRAFNLLRPGGTMGLIATNTIAQGDTRSTGLRYICTHGGTIYAARRRYKWPGQAAVVVSIVHIFKSYSNMPPPPCDLDGRKVDQITAFLFHAGGHDDPHKLPANAGQSFQGSILLGMGFTFDDTDKKGIASPIAEMHRLITKDPRNAQRIFPYIGGEEICTSPT